MPTKLNCSKITRSPFAACHSRAARNARWHLRGAHRRRRESEAPEMLGLLKPRSVGVASSCWLRSLAGGLVKTSTSCSPARSCTAFSTYQEFTEYLLCGRSSAGCSYKAEDGSWQAGHSLVQKTCIKSQSCPPSPSHPRAPSSSRATPPPVLSLVAFGRCKLGGVRK